jgi:hypothetical protein
MKHLPKRWLLADRQIQNVIKAGALALAFLCNCEKPFAQVIEHYAVEAGDTFGVGYFSDGLIDANNKCHAITGFMNVFTVGGQYYPSGKTPYKYAAITSFVHPDSGFSVFQLGGYGSGSSLQLNIERDKHGNLYSVLFEDSFVILGNDTLREIPPKQGEPWAWSHFNYLVVTDSIGNYLWNYQLKGIRTHVDDITLGKDGSVYIAGQFDSLIIFGDDTIKKSPMLPYQPILIKLDSNGKFVWWKWLKVTFRSAKINVIETDDEGYLYCGVYIERNAIEIDSTVINASNGTAVLIKMDMDGDIVWYRQLKASETASIKSIKVKNNRLFISGGIIGAFSYPSSKYNFTYENHGYIAEFSIYNGSIKWFRPTGGLDMRKNLVISENSIYYTGYFSKYCFIGIDTTIYTPHGLSNFFLIKLDLQGRYQWVYTKIGEYRGYPYWLSVNKNKEIAIGLSYSFDFVFKGDTFKQPDWLWERGLILRLQDTSGIKPVGTIEETVTLNEVIIYPNPAQTRLTLYAGHAKGTRLRYELYNLQGVRLKEGDFTTTEGGTHKSIDISTLTQGVYLFMLHEGNESTTKKLVIQR